MAVAVPAPGAGEGFWAGAPSAAVDRDGSVVVAYRLRLPAERGTAVAIARTDDGERLTTVGTLEKSRFAAESLERPALLRTDSGRWRLYVSCATPQSKHWHIDVLEAADPGQLADAEARTVFPGDAHVGVKDPVVRVLDGQWHAWVCCHPLDVLGDEDRMRTFYATSADGLDWSWQGVALAGRAGSWDERGARVTSVLPGGMASYDGRASVAENFSERTGVAEPAIDKGRFLARNEGPVAAVRYLDVLPLERGAYRIYYEAPLADGSHELRTELIRPRR